MDEQQTTEIPRGYCQCGCGERTTIAPFASTRLGVQKGEARRFLHNHDKKRHLRPDGPPADYVVDAHTGCWGWQGALNSKGYGYSRGTTAHRAVYEDLVGPIPEGLTLDHLCRNRACVNPAHLEPVTLRENIRRAVEYRRRTG